MRQEMPDEEALKILVKKSDKKLSRMLDIVQAQIPIAFKKRLDESLKRLQKLEELIVQARVIKSDEALSQKKKRTKQSTLIFRAAKRIWRYLSSL